MKTLIALLFVVSVGGGQDWKPLQIVVGPAFPPVDSIPNTPIHSLDWVIFENQCITLSDWLAYTAGLETVTEAMLRDSLNTLIGRIRVLIAQNDYASLHDVKLLLGPMGYKKQPSLVGFMDWIKQRRKRWDEK